MGVKSGVYQVKKMMRAAALSMALLSAGAMTSQAVQAKELNIAVVDVAKVLHDIPQRKAIEAKLKSEFDPRVREVQRLETEGQTLVAQLKKNESFMSADDKTKSQRRLAELQAQYNMKGQALQEDQRRRFGEEQQKIFKQISDAVSSIAKSEGYDLVVTKQAVVYTNDKNDISDEVIQKVSKQ